jgi:hypothetical protein
MLLMTEKQMFSNDHHGEARQAWHGWAWRGQARPGTAGPDLAWQGRYSVIGDRRAMNCAEPFIGPSGASGERTPCLLRHLVRVPDASLFFSCGTCPPP